MAPAIKPAQQPVPSKTVSGSPASVSGDSSTRTRRASMLPRPQSNVIDGTSQLLKSGGWTLGTGIVFALLTETFFGGIGPQGPHTSIGWMALIVTMMCLPFGSLLFLLGALKWLRNRRLPNI